MKMRSCLLAVLAVLGARSARAQEIEGATESPRTTALEFKLGGYKPLIDNEAGLTTRPYEDTFGAGSMLLFEIEADRLLWQKIGSAGIGFSIGYAEKYARARVVGTDEPAADPTALHVLPLKLLGAYRFDYAALHWNVPLAPYVKAGVAYTPWWATKGGRVEFANGTRGAGGVWGYFGTVGLALMLDTFDPRLARDFDSDTGVNHSYLFAEYVHQNVNDFGGGGLDLSSRHWMFGLTLEY